MKIYFDMVGCRLNQAEIEQLAGRFRQAGHQVVDGPAGADLVVVNTCAVTAAASSDSRQKVRQLNQSGAERILLTGCWATLEPEMAKSLPGVTGVYSNAEKMTLVDAFIDPENNVPDKHIPRVPLPGMHHRTRSFIKVQDGCDNLCTFCITRMARGASRSLPFNEILESIQQAETGGVHEVVLTGVNLGAWGRDMKKRETINHLLRDLLAQTSVERIRLSSIEPWDLDDEFLDLWKNRRLCRHFHLPLQSGSAGVLRRMLRKTTPQEFARLVEKARERIPGMAITTDLIVGFPGETEDEFIENLEFVKSMQFNSGHVFRYSPREGTPAAKMPGRVHGRIARDRAERLREILDESEEMHLNTLLGSEAEVLWESAEEIRGGGWLLHGLTDQYVRVEAFAPINRWNRMDRVLLEFRIRKVISAKIIAVD